MQTKTEEVEKYFTDKILHSELKPGDKLPSVKNIKDILGVGHVTAANALQNLSKKGYIKTIRGQGAFVCNLNDIKKSAGIITYAFGHGLSPELTGFYMRTYQSAKNAANSSNYDLDFIAIDLNDPAECRLNGADGAVAIIFDTDNILKQCNLQSPQYKKVPLIYCGMGSNLFGLNSVTPDNYTGARLATEYLIKNGHQNITFITTVKRLNDYRGIERLRGWKDAMQSKNLSSKNIIEWHHCEHSQPLTSLLEKIKNKSIDTPTALLVTNDAMALEIKQLALQIGIHIPQDLSIMGFENHPTAAPAEISTVTCDETYLGHEAILLVENILRYPECQPLHIRVPMQLIERNSVKCINLTNHTKK